jgi:kinesin family protein 22
MVQISAATKHRSVGATNLNRASSRSHAILTIEASIVDPVANISTSIFFSGFHLLNSISALTGKINLVDLAGSENNKVSERKPFMEKETNLTPQLTGNDPSRMAESAAINKSLSVLGQVVHALNQGAVSLLHNWSLAYFNHEI